MKFLKQLEAVVWAFLFEIRQHRIIFFCVAGNGSGLSFNRSCRSSRMLFATWSPRLTFRKSFSQTLYPWSQQRPFCQSLFGNVERRKQCYCSSVLLYYEVFWFTGCASLQIGFLLLKLLVSVHFHIIVFLLAGVWNPYWGAEYREWSCCCAVW